MMRRTFVALFSLLPAIAAAQGTGTGTTYANRLSVGSGTPGTAPTVGTVRLEGLGTSGGGTVLFKDASHNIIARVLAKADLPTSIAYEDEPNIFTVNQTISSTVPSWQVSETDAASGVRASRWVADGGGFGLEHTNDAFSLVISRPWRSSAYGSIVLAPYTGQVLPPAPYAGFIGSPTEKWLAIYAAELNVETLVAQDTLATTGGRVLVLPTTSLIEDLADSATTIKVKHNNLASGDRIYLESGGRVEFMAVTSGATRLNRLGGGLGNPSFDVNATGWTSDGTVSLTSTDDARYAGAKGLRWVYTSGSANVYSNVSGTLFNSGTFTVSLYVKRRSGGAVVPTATNWRIYISSANLVPSTAIDLGDGWYRLYATGTTSSSTDHVVGLLNMDTDTEVFIDNVQVEQGSTLTPYLTDSSSYTVTRDLDGTGADGWEAGTAVANTGQTGNGFIDLYSTRGVKAGTEVGPTIVGNVRLSSTYNDWTPRWAIGNLNGLYGYGSTTFGVAMGDPTATYVTIEPVNGFRIIGGGSTKVQIDTSGNASFASGNATIDATSVRITANTANAFAAGNGFNFTPTVNTGGNFGLAAHDLSGFRGLRLENIHTGSAVTTIGIQATNSTSSASISTVASASAVGIINLSADEVRPSTALHTKLGESTDIWGSSYIRHMWLPEDSTQPASPASGTEVSMRMCGDKVVFTFNDGGTVRYKSFDLTGTNTVWAQATSAPTGC